MTSLLLWNNKIIIISEISFKCIETFWIHNPNHRLSLDISTEKSYYVVHFKLWKFGQNHCRNEQDIEISNSVLKKEKKTLETSRYTQLVDLQFDLFIYKILKST